MTDREELKELLHREGAYCGDCDFEGGETCGSCQKMLGKYADAIIKAGWHLPAQTDLRTSTEREVDEQAAASRSERPHVYMSTACWHHRHDRCRKVCKFCDAACSCPCHASPATTIRRIAERLRDCNPWDYGDYTPNVQGIGEDILEALDE